MERVEPAHPDARPAIVWLGFLAMCIGMFMAILDVQVVATSLPTIQSALGIDPDQMSWIQTAYLIAEVVAIPLTGLLTRLLTMRWLFVVAIGLFVTASAGCAASGSFGELVAWRVLQGFSGGTLIPSVFSAVFILFPNERQALATTIAGVLAVLAPTVGPIVGGWLTETYSWHWLFLINILPGIASAVLAAFFLPRQPADPSELRHLDGLSLLLMATALMTLELSLKEAPTSGWTSAYVLSLLAICLVSGGVFIARTLRRDRPIVDLGNFADRNFLVGSTLSFVLGIGLFGSVYLMPVFLAFVRGHDALEIGTTMLVTGIAQLVTAPIAVALEKRMDARLLSAVGFALFAIGVGMSAFQDPRSDYDAMFWPQIVRGVAIMFCLLPPTRLALGTLPADRIPDASGLFNLMRNLGGAIGIALIDTIIYTRSEPLGQGLWARLQTGDAAAAAFVGAPLQAISGHNGEFDADTTALLDPLVQTAASVQAINEAWMVVAILTACALLCVPFARRPAST
ncbi:drug resistance transporter, EmrB/QacA subfamily [Rhizobium leguminosarum bv. trifolii WSM597]|uniref:Drug resistance transporter, EmrB/QacA subfamily n=2 Tax=Rhizobium TaxID=379 RepID=J0GV89_RHILT|nr:MULTISPECIES: DHA2 family efflux MFS transporter permease subunit [Rhizobium]EJB01495.1 drug resistance transporter, EmrB/QacA subfamily [Rhizobium leguminosarum bv. trifolii WSM597]KPH06388.1 MFS transporter [Rhizobium acidisoli]QAS81940.1 DHA2 family efflux MFS transporter permease subunit [Rhizobium acidisoli]